MMRQNMVSCRYTFLLRTGWYIETGENVIPLEQVDDNYPVCTNKNIQKPLVIKFTQSAVKWVLVGYEFDKKGVKKKRKSRALS